MEHHCQNPFGKRHSGPEITPLYVSRHKEHHLSKCSEIIGKGEKIIEFWFICLIAKPSISCLKKFVYVTTPSKVQ